MVGFAFPRGMGKGNWHPKHRQHSGASDLSSARGFPCVAGSCDTVREREAARELVTLVQDCLDALYPDVLTEEEERKGDIGEDDRGHENEPRSMSIQDELVREISSVKTRSHRSTQRVVSLHTGIRGFVVVKIRSRAVCPVRVVLGIFDRVRKERLPVARHLVKLLPLQHTFYPNQELMVEALDSFTRHIFGHCAAAAAAATVVREREEEDGEINNAKRRKYSDGSSSEGAAPRLDGKEGEEIEGPGSLVEDTSPGGGLAQRSYTINFNRRSHDVITRHVAIAAVRRAMPSTCVYNYRVFQDVFLFEVFRNLAGVSYIEDIPSDLAAEFNIRKFQLALLGEESRAAGGSHEDDNGVDKPTDDNAAPAACDNE